jgi:hypothetical protein
MQPAIPSASKLGSGIAPDSRRLNNQREGGTKMAEWKQIKAYGLAWNAKDNSGVMQLKLENGESHKLEVDSASELSALAEILRNEKPVFFSAELSAVRTGWELAE